MRAHAQGRARSGSPADDSAAQIAVWRAHWAVAVQRAARSGDPGSPPPDQCTEAQIAKQTRIEQRRWRSADAASSIRRRSAAWTILRDWTFRSRTRASALWMARARSFGK